MYFHPQVHIQFGEHEADVDEKIAPLLVELWKADINTTLSCQENRPGVIWIEFMTAIDAENFLNIVVRYRPGLNTFYNRVCSNWEGKKKLKFWEFNASPLDLGLEQQEDEEGYVDECHSGKPDFVFGVSVRFPWTDYDTVLRRMTAHNAELEVQMAQLAPWHLTPRECVGSAPADGRTSTEE